MRKPYIHKAPRYRSEQMHVTESEMPDACARLAIEIVRSHAMVAAMPDGEDSAGRQRL